jgi:UDP-N-acetylglucosamine acyltransferase
VEAELMCTIRANENAGGAVNEQDSPTAIVDPKAELDSSVEVGPYSIIGPNVRIGAGTVVGPHVVIEGHTTIGKDNKIFQFASLGAAPQDKKWAGEPTRLEIGDRNTIREFVHLQPGHRPGRGRDPPGRRQLDLGLRPPGARLPGRQQHDLLEQRPAGRPRARGRLGDPVGLLRRAPVLQDRRPCLHRHVHQPDPGRAALRAGLRQSGRAHGVNIEGLKRRGFTREQINAIRAAYKHIYRSGLTLEEAKAKLAEEKKRPTPRRSSAPCATSSAPRPVASSAEPGASTSLALVAGEVSGDMLAARLMAGLRRSCRRALSGIGGRACSSRAWCPTCRWTR